jgi:hypothetical protein
MDKKLFSVAAAYESMYQVAEEVEVDEGVTGAVAGGVLGSAGGVAGTAAGAYLGHKIQKIAKQHHDMHKPTVAPVGGTKPVKNEEVKYPHMMYDPKTGKEVTAKTPADHAKFAKMGYTHEKPKMDEVSHAGTSFSMKAMSKMKPQEKEKPKKESVNMEEALEDDVKKEDVTSADRKPENVTGPDGKTRTRMVPVKKKSEAKMDPVGKADADIDNDGDVDKSDEYLHNRRKAIKKAMKKEDMDIQETNHVYSDSMLKSGLGHAKRAGMTVTHHGSSPFGERATISHKDPKKLAKYVDKHLGGMSNVEKRTSTKESTIRNKLMSIWEDAAEITEADRAKHYKGATKPENMPKDDARSDKKMMDGSPSEKHGKGEKEDPESKKAEDSTKAAPMRNNDNKQGDKAIIKSATPDHPAHKTTKEQVEEIKAAYESMYKKEDENGS